ncbi:5855_t:CDS:2 [Funneliformis geosporum]|uniref:5855_t:CDS:1 n=1 Tax=Funneliformis geosporum TaxID=1117311 RepID=A0A9W4WKB8_9GLOM|nr:5855_t:CDS:2 [Funneliformis geosporum]
MGLQILEKIIEKFIPLIRFTKNIPSEPFCKLRPFKAAIPHEVYKRIDSICHKEIFRKEPTLPPRFSTRKPSYFTVVLSQAIFHSGLSKDLTLLLKKPDEFNMIIQVGEDAREFRVHSVILQARSPYFKSIFSYNTIMRKDDVFMFNIPNITSTVFELSNENILWLIIASDEFLLQELFNFVLDHLIENLANWIHQNIVFVLNNTFRLAVCKKLIDYCLERICEYPQTLIASKNFSSLDKDILFHLLKRDDLKIEEIDAWNFLIKWCNENTPGLGIENVDSTKWSQENLEAFKKTISQFIPIIRFVEISSDDFFDKVRPYKAVIPHNIYEEVAEFYFKNTLPKSTMSQPRSINTEFEIESKLIRSSLGYMIAQWIEKENAENLFLKKKYKFKLLYRGSRDGISIEAFRTKCNNHGPCLVLAKERLSSKIYGGYNPLDFVQDCSKKRFYKTSESFIFLLEDTNVIISRVVDTSRAIVEKKDYGFNFGESFYMGDKSIYLNYNGSYDEKVIDKSMNTTFLPEEIEIFRIL